MPPNSLLSVSVRRGCLGFVLIIYLFIHLKTRDAAGGKVYKDPVLFFFGIFKNF